MKRQVVGVRRTSDELEEADTSDCKRIKLLNNQDESVGSEVKSLEDKSMDSSQNGCHNHEENHLSIISENGPAHEHISNSSQNEESHEQSSFQMNGNSSTESSSNDPMLNHNHESSCDEVVVQVSSNESSIVSELYYTNSCPNSEEVQENQPMHVLLNHDLDAHNDESTDSFQSDGFTAMKYSNDEKQISESNSSQEQVQSHENSSSADSSVLQTSVDIDSLTLSHLDVTELEGHVDVIFSVAADEDFILSASADTTVKVWKVEDASEISNLSGHRDSVTSLLLLNHHQSNILSKKLSLSKDTRIAITGSLDCHVKVWSVLEGQELASVYTFNGILCLGFLDSESYIIVGTEGGKLELWDVSTSKVVQSVHAHDDSISDIKVKDSNIYSASKDGTVKVWSFEDEEIYPVYTRKRKAISTNKTGFEPALWRTVDVFDNIMYLGDNTNSLKVLDWRAGRIRLFKNQVEAQGICQRIRIEKDILLSTFYDSSSDVGGINVWKIPDMTYICTLSGEIIQDIYCLAVVQHGNKLRIVSGGHQLLVWDFDFTKAPKKKESQDEFHINELDTVGHEIDEKLVEVKKNSDASNKSITHKPWEKIGLSNQWCNVM